MKRVINTLILFAASFFVNEICAQVMPAPYNSNTKISYIRTWDAVAPITNTDSLLTRSYTDVRQTTIYFDGLGRPLQTVVKKGSLVTGDTARDLVSPVIYDEFSREQYKFLPFAANNTGSNTSMSDGFFKLNPFQQDSTFNKGMFSDESWFYSKSVFEASALNRATENFAPGNSWVGTSTEAIDSNRRSLKIKAWVNTVADSVRIWNVTNVNDSFGTCSSSGIYEAGELFKSVTVDEHYKQVIEFKDKDGLVILRKVQLTATADTGTGKNHVGWLCTYYIYDDLHQLRCVVQPKAVEAINYTSWALSDATILNELCFRYGYDSKGRMTVKKVPGAGIVYLIYDGRGRIVMTQDSLLRAAHKWLYTKYDGLNRPDTTGLITDGSYYNDPAHHRVLADASTDYPNAGSYSSNNEILTQTFYDNYNWRSTEGNPLSSSRDNTYDSYLQTPSNSTWPYQQDATVQTARLTGMMTGTKIKIVGTSSTYLYSISFYDEKARAIQVQSTNVSSETDIITTQYDWCGQPALTITKNGKGGANSQTTVAVRRPGYDYLFRIDNVEVKISNSKINGGTMPGWTKLGQYYYNALGEVRKKTYNGDSLEKLSFDYNIRGWLLGVNRDYVKDTTSASNWFGFDLGYDKTSFTVNGSSKSYSGAQYNGNIEGMLWKSTGDDRLRKYDFTYDAVNRLIGADFNQLTNNSFGKSAGIDYSVNNLSYDANGNILRMDQKGWKLEGSITIDSLLYTYTTNTNKLLNVLDYKNDTATRLGDFRSSKTYIDILGTKTTAATDYLYDANGNLTIDKNKDITSIQYNYLGLPDSIMVKGKGTIKYMYDATGTKLKKIVVDSTASLKKSTTLYLISNYVNDTLQFIVTEEGRARAKDSTLIVYDYFIKDHLGNVRLVLTNQKDTAFYPAATMEVGLAGTEEALYDNLATTRAHPPRDYPRDTSYSNPNSFVAQVTKNASKLGPGKLLKVMAGDKFNVRVSSWWQGTIVSGSVVSSLDELIILMAGGVAYLVIIWLIS